MEPTNSDASEDQCLAPSELRNWLSGKRDLSTQEGDHLKHCQRCQRLAESFSDAPDLHAAQSLATTQNQFADEAELAAIRNRVKRANVDYQDPSFVDTREKQRSDDTDGSTALNPTVGESLKKSELRDAIGRQTEFFEPRISDVDPAVELQQLQHSFPDRYRLQKRIAAGGSGAVYLGYDQQLDREVAVKILIRDSMRDRQRFHREAKILASLEHANVVRVFDFGSLENSPSRSETTTPAHYLVMEYVAGGSLATHKLADSDQRWRDIAMNIFDAATGLSAAHQQGIIHRDVKPSNLLITSTAQVKVADFGIARLASPTTLVTHTGDILGTPEYMSPEQVTPNATLDATTDVYGLGTTLYYLLTGTTPFRGAPAAVLRQIVDVTPTSPKILNPEIPVDLETICLKAIEKSPDDRYESAKSLASDLERFLKGEPISARPASNWTKVNRYLKQNPTLKWPLLAVAGLTCLLLAGSVTAALVFGKQNQELKSAVANSERALRDALNAADELLVSVTTDVELLPSTPGSQQVSQQLLNKAKEYYLTCLQSDGDSPEVQFQFARARAGLSKIALRLGDPDESIVEADAALELLDAVQRHFEEEGRGSNVGVESGSEISASKIAEVRAQTLSEFAMALVQKTQHQNALVRFEDAIRNIDFVFENDPSPENADGLLAQKSNLLRNASIAAGNIGQVDEARSLVEQAIELSSRLVDESPSNVLYRTYAAEAEYSLGAQCMRREGISEGKDHLLKALAILDAVQEGSPGEIRVNELQASIRMNLGQAESMLGNPQAAEQEFANAIQQHERLMQLEPTVPAHRMSRILAIFNSTMVDFELENFEIMARKYQDIIPALDEFIERNPENVDYQQTQSMVLSNLAIVNKELGKLDEALASLQSATESFRNQAELLDKSPDSLYPIALNLYEMSGIHLDLEDYDAAARALDESDEVVEEILASQSDFFPALQHRADTLLRRSEIALLRQPPMIDSAIATAQSASTEFYELADQFPEQPDLLVSFAYAKMSEGEAYSERADFIAARKAVQIAIDQYLPESPDEADDLASEVLADAYLVLANISRDELAGDHPDARRSELQEQLESELSTAETYGADPESLTEIRNDSRQ